VGKGDRRDSPNPDRKGAADGTGLAIGASHLVTTRTTSSRPTWVHHSRLLVTARELMDRRWTSGATAWPDGVARRVKATHAAAPAADIIAVFGTPRRDSASALTTPLGPARMGS